MVLTSPISKLDSDTFLMVLDAITCQIPSTSARIRKVDRPLTIIRATSQVCQGWRRLLLSSPWIWERVVDLTGANDLPGSRRIEWMDEVVKRAGSAPLWISGKVEAQRYSALFNTQAYFNHLLEAWQRIEQLSVVIVGQNLHDDIRDQFLSPAPILRSFNVHFDQIRGPLFWDTLQPGSTESLFADHAPSLRKIRVDRVSFKLDSPWLSNIREMSPNLNRFTLKEIFFLLQHTPALERIGLIPRLQPSDGWPSPFPKPNLPNLSSLSLYTTLAVAARVLDYISPANLSSFHITARDPYSALNDPYILSSFKQNMPLYISSYFTSKPASSFFLVITNGELTFSCEDTRSSKYQETQFNVIIRTSYSDQQDSNNVLACLLDTFTHSPVTSGNPYLFQPITELTLALKQVQPTLFQNLYSMFSVFQHVQVIETNEQWGQTLWAISESCSREDSGDRPPILFPELNTVRLSSLNAERATVYPGLPMFLMKRKRMGFPVLKLVLIGPRGPEDLSAFEAVDGLEVVWKEQKYDLGEGNVISRYICGSGQPERLKNLA